MLGGAREWRRSGKGNKYGGWLEILLPFSIRKGAGRGEGMETRRERQQIWQASKDYVAF